MQEFLEPQRIKATLAMNPHPMADDWITEINYDLLAANEATWAVRRMLGKKDWTEFQFQEFSRNANEEAVDKLISGEIPIHWHSFSANTNIRAVAHMEENLDKVCWSILNGNSSAGRLLNDKNIDRMICANESDEAMEILDRNPKYIDLYLLVSNPNPRVIDILRKHKRIRDIECSPTSLILNNLAKNTNASAIKMLTDNLENFQWREIWSNPSPAAFDLIWACFTNTWKEKYCRFVHPHVVVAIEYRLSLSKKTWALKELCKNTNPAVMEILKFYPKFVDYDKISANSIIFK